MVQTFGSPASEDQTQGGIRPRLALRGWPALLQMEGSRVIMVGGFEEGAWTRPDVTGEPGPGGLGLVTAPSYSYLRRRGLGSAARRASSSATRESDCDICRQKKQVHPVSAPAPGAGRRRKSALWGLPGSRQRQGRGQGQSAQRSGSGASGPSPGALGQWGWAMRLLEERLVSRLPERGAEGLVERAWL